MKSAVKPAYAAWQVAEVEAQDAYMMLRLAMVKYVEGISLRPEEMLLERAIATRMRSIASMQVVIDSLA